MSEYIKLKDVEAAIDIALDRFELPNDEAVRGRLHNQVGALPSADVAEVVRCKDCRWNPYTPHPYYLPEVVAGYIWCPAIADPAPDQHERYCSYGERKEQDNEE